MSFALLGAALAVIVIAVALGAIVSEIVRGLGGSNTAANLGVLAVGLIWGIVCAVACILMQPTPWWVVLAALLAGITFLGGQVMQAIYPQPGSWLVEAYDSIWAKKPAAPAS